MATVVTNINLSYVLYIINVPQCGAKVKTQSK